MVFIAQEKGTIRRAPPTELYFVFYKPKTKEISSAKQKLEMSSGIMSYENEFMNCEL